MPQCLTPMDVRIKETNRVIQVPCSKCVNCILRKGSEWSFRLMQEEKNADTAYFVTFTYANQFVPLSKKGFMVLDKHAMPSFFKSLRANKSYSKHVCAKRNNILPYWQYSFTSEKPIKYYAVGEYGTRTKRPHYHAIIFNADLELIFKSWQFGEIHIGQVTQASVGYTMKYMLKKGTVPEHKNDDRIPEFGLMSKGLGLSYVNENTKFWHTQNLDRMYLPLIGGIKCTMPRYYKERIFTKEFRALAGQKQLALLEQRKYEIRVDANGSIWYDYKDYQSMYAALQSALRSNERKRYLSSLNNYL